MQKTNEVLTTSYYEYRPTVMILPKPNFYSIQTCSFS